LRALEKQQESVNREDPKRQAERKLLSDSPGKPGERDTFRPAADADAYSAETVVKAVPRELLADLAAALRAPALPRVGAKQEPPAAADEPMSLGEDDATVVDHRLDLDILAGLRHEQTADGGRVPSPAPTPVVPRPTSASIDEPAPSSRRGAPPPDLSLPPPPPEPQAPVHAPAPAASGANAGAFDVDENTDFRAGTRWPWITAIVVVVVSFAVTLAILRAV
jgi:hypothetical protein